MKNPAAKPGFSDDETKQFSANTLVTFPAAYSQTQGLFLRFPGLHSISFLYSRAGILWQFLV
jgi:hypothetical protein